MKCLCFPTPLGNLYILPVMTRLARFKFDSVDRCDGRYLHYLDRVDKPKYAYV